MEMTQGGHLAVCRVVAPVRRPGLGCSPPGRREVRPEKPLTCAASVTQAASACVRATNPDLQASTFPCAAEASGEGPGTQWRHHPGSGFFAKLPLAKTWRTGFKHTSATSGKNVRSQHATFSRRDQTTENSASPTFARRITS